MDIRAAGGRVSAGPHLVGGRPAGLAFIVGLWLAPFVLSTWAHVATFDPSGLRPDDLDELRRRRKTPRD
jgi:hypothetical protein